MKALWDKYYNGCDMSDLFNSEEYLAKSERRQKQQEVQAEQF